MSTIHNIAFSREQVVWIRREIYTDQTSFTSINSPKQFQTSTLVDIDVRGQQEMDFFTGGSIIIDYGLVFWSEESLKHFGLELFFYTNFLLHKKFIDGLESCCGLLWCFYQLFGLSFWRHPFTSEYPLVSKWCNAFNEGNLFNATVWSYLKYLKNNSNQISLIYHLVLE